MLVSLGRTALLPAVLAGVIVATTPCLASDREQTVCGSVSERLAFWFWSKAAPAPDEKRLEGLSNVERIDFRAGDNNLLVGFKIAARDTRGDPVAPKGYLLIAQGNAVLADQMARGMYFFAEHGYDVYAFDFRGFGRSEGNRRLNAIILDYGEIADSLSAKYTRTLFYGFSFGGVVVMNLIGSGHTFDAAVIDSAPSRVSEFGCPERFDPVRNLPVDARRLMVIVGAQDQVLKSKVTRELLEVGRSRGAAAVESPEFAHPFMDKFSSIHERRMQMISNFLLGTGDGRPSGGQ